MSAFDRFAGFGQRRLARTTALFGCRRSVFGYRSCFRSGGWRRYGCRRWSRFRLAPRADRRRQERNVQRGWRFIRSGNIIAGATFGARAQATCGTRFTHKRIVCCLNRRFPLDGGNTFARKSLGCRRFGIAVAIAIKATVAIASTFVSVFTGAIFALPIFAGPIFAGPIVAGPIITGPIVAVPAAFLPFAAFRALGAFRTFGSLWALRPVLTLFAFAAGCGAIKAEEITLDAEFAAVVFAVLFLPAFAIAAIRAGALFVLAEAGIGDDAEIVIGKLQIVFCLHPVAIHVGVLRKFTILFEQLGGVAPGATVDPVELLTTTILRTIVIAPATAVVVTTIVIQLGHFLN